jgi:hypothetical protein
MKNLHAVALGRLGGSKGGRARAAVLSPRRRQEIARAAAHARSRSLTRAERAAIARRAALARWASPISTALEAPAEVRRLLKSYELSDLRWSDTRDRYTIVREVLVRGGDTARKWLRRSLKEDAVRDLVRRFRGAGCSEPERRKLRNELGLSTEDVPVRSYIGFAAKSSRGRRS